VKVSNILFLSELFYPHGSGGELATSLYAKFLGAAGFKVVVITNRFAGEPRVAKTDNIAIHRLALSDRDPMSKYVLLLRLDAIHSTLVRRMIKWADLVYIPRFWYTAISLAKAHHKPVMLHLHGYYPACPIAVLYDMSKNALCQHRNRWTCSPRCIMAYERGNGAGPREVLLSAAMNTTVGLYLGKLARLCDSIVCVSNAQRDLLVTHMPILRSKLRVVYNPLPDVSEFDSHNGHFGYFGGTSPVKGFDILYRALQNLHPMIETDVTQVPKSRRLEALGIKAHGELSKNSYHELWKKIQVVIVPSICPEPMPYVVTEAVLGRRLVIASHVGGIPEQVEGLDGAFLFQPGNHSELASLMAYLRDLPSDEKIDLGWKNRESFLKRYDEKRNLKHFVATLENAIGL
jgi:glycosyltransferase involved in cell wall biosynthesis